jgi:hypothetical protein
VTRIICRIICVAVCCSACTTPPAPERPPAEVIRVEVPRIEQRVCPDRRPPRDLVADLPDDDEDLAAVPEGDFETLGKIYRAARDRYRVWLQLDEVQIRSCSSGG